MILWKDPHRVHADFLHDLFDHRQRDAVRIRKAASREIIAQHVFTVPHMQHVQIKPAGLAVRKSAASPDRTGQSVPADLDFPTLESTKINPR